MTQQRKLTTEAAELLSASAEARLAYLQQDHWIGYTEAAQLLSTLDGMVHAPDKGRPVNMLLIAPTNNGKSFILRRFAQAHAPAPDASGERVERPVVLVDMPPVPGEERLYHSILDSLGAIYKPRDPADVKRTQVLRLLRGVGCKVLVVDEVSNALVGTQRQQQQVLNALKQLGNELSRPLVLSGIETTAAILRQDAQMQNRFPIRELPLWQVDGDFQRLVMSMESFLPLREASGLHRGNISVLLHGMSGGLIGELSTLVREAAIYAIESGTEKITPEVLAALKWQSPSERNARAGAIGMGL